MNKAAIFNHDESVSIFLIVASIIYLITGNIVLSLILSGLITVLIAFMLWGSGYGINWNALISRFKRLDEETDVDIPIDRYTLRVGHSKASRKPVYQRLPHMGHIFVSGMTRYGKTVLIHNWIKGLIETHSSEDLKIGFSDAKMISFNIYSKLNHLFAPIARNKDETTTLVRLVKREMERRLTLFGEIDGKLCANVDDYYDLTGDRLPWIVVFFDELADSVDPGSETEKIIITIAKMGLAAGIQLVLATQRPTREGISHEAQSQCSTWLCTYMRGSREYQISGVSADAYKHMKPEKGLFMMYSPETVPAFLEEYPEMSGWGFIKSELIETSVLETVAAKHSGQVPGWPEEHLPQWGGSSEEKIAAIKDLEDLLGRVPTKTEIAENFDITPKTAATWYERTYDK